MNLLFLSNWFPYPPDNGSKLRIYHLLRGLAARHTVNLITFSNAGEAARPAPAELLEICRSVQCLPGRPYNPSSLKALLGLFSSRPRVLVDRYDPAMAALIEDTLRSKRFDLVIASQWYMADYYRPAWGPPAIFEEVELGLFQDMRRQAANPLKRLRHSLTNLKLNAFLRGFLPNFCACTVVSPGERSLLEQTTGYNRVEVLPNGVDVAAYQGEFAAPAEAQGFPYLIYTGSFRYQPNYDAMRWFTGEVLPLVLARTPQLRLLITGDHAGLPLPEIEPPGGGGRAVRLTGFVPDVRPYVRAAAASLAPLRSGGGTRLKIIEAMALRTPVIATSKGAEGLAVVPGKHLLVADTPQDYAAAVLRLLAEPALAAELAGNAYALVRERYDWQALIPSFLALVERCAAFPAN